MAKDMYQKRKERKEKNNNQDYSQTRTNINWYPGHMAKTKRLIKEKINLIDVFYELIDSRIPYSSKISDIDELIKNKPKILIFTKYDLCDRKETDKFIKYYENHGYIVLKMNLNNNSDFKTLVEATKNIMSKVNSKRLNNGLKEKEVRAVVIGVPNVGKSTLINALACKKVTRVENKPGVTKNLVWLNTNFNISVLDTPGILWPKFETEEEALNLASMTAIKSEILNIDEVAIHILNKLNNHYPEILKNRYKIDHISSDIEETYDEIAGNLGLMKKGSYDYERVSNTIINDIKKNIVYNITFDRSEILDKIGNNKSVK